MNGFEMMVKNLLGIEPAQLQKDMQAFMASMVAGIKDANDKLQNINVRLQELERKTDTLAKALRVPLDKASAENLNSGVSTQ